MLVVVMVKNRINIAVMFNVEGRDLENLEGKGEPCPTSIFGTGVKITTRTLSEINIISRA